MTVTTQNVLLHAPTEASYTGSTTVNGRVYKAAAGSPLTAPDYDADQLEAAGWVKAAPGGGTTAQRPANPVKGTKFADTTAGVTVVWDGKNWRNAVSGAIA